MYIRYFSSGKKALHVYYIPNHKKFYYIVKEKRQGKLCKLLTDTYATLAQTERSNRDKEELARVEVPKLAQRAFEELEAVEDNLKEVLEIAAIFPRLLPFCIVPPRTLEQVGEELRIAEFMQKCKKYFFFNG